MRDLDVRADRLEQILADLGIQAQVYGGQVLPQVVAFNVQLARGERLKKLRGAAEDVAARLGVPGVLVNRHPNGVISIEVPQRGDTTVAFSALMTELEQKGITPPKATALLGLGNDGQPLLLNLDSPDVRHVLVAGQTGSGKTELLRTMLASLAVWNRRHELCLWLVDPKDGELSDFAGIEIVQAIYEQVEHVPEVLDLFLARMEERSPGKNCAPRLVLVIDELADLALTGGRPITEALTRLVQRGGGVGIHVVAATQRPSAKVVEGLMKANFPVRICGAVGSALDASIALGMPKTGAERLLGKGDMIVLFQSRSIRFKGALTQPQDIQELATGRWRARTAASRTPSSLAQRLKERLGLRGRGRPAEPPTEGMIAHAMNLLRADGDCSQRAVRRWHQEEYGRDVNPPRAAAAIEEAKRRLQAAGILPLPQ